MDDGLLTSLSIDIKMQLLMASLFAAVIGAQTNHQCHSNRSLDLYCISKYDHVSLLSDQLNRRLLYSPHINLLIVPCSIDSWIKSGNIPRDKTVKSYFTPMDRAFESLRSFTEIIESGMDITPYFIIFYLELRDALRIHLDLTASINTTILRTDYRTSYRKAVKFLDDMYQFQRKRRMNPFAPYIAPECISWLKRVVLDWWFHAFQKIMRLKVNELYKNLRISKIISPQQMLNLTQEVSVCAGFINFHCIGLYDTMRRSFDGYPIGNEFTLTTAVDDITMLKMHLEIAGLIHNLNGSRIAVNLLDYSMSDLFATLLEEQGCSRGNIKLHSVRAASGRI